MEHTFPEGGERIAKALARRGICSRREAERLIEQGAVEVDGQVLTTPAFKVTATSQIKVNGQPVPEESGTRVWRFHKPAGLVTTTRDPQGRQTVFEALPEDMPRVISVGRLDLTSEGLLLLTNDGELARKLELPSSGWERRYRVRIFGRAGEADIKKLTDGIDDGGQLLKAASAEIDRVQGGNSWLTIVLTEGKNREIRRMMEALGMRVNRLIRTAYGPFELGKLAAGAVEEVPAAMVHKLTGAGPRPPAHKPPAPARRPRKNAPHRR